jgi:hypothetical protein
MTTDTITPSQILGTLMENGEIKLGDKKVFYTKFEYRVEDKDGNVLFSKVPSAISFWEMMDYLGLDRY